MTLSKRLEDGFWTTIGWALPEGAKVFLSPDTRAPSAFLDVMGKNPSVLPSVETSQLIFVDLEPEANWAHKCLWVFAGNGSLYAVQHEWPPSDEKNFSEMQREGERSKK